MSKIYSFEFSGNKEMFLNGLNQFASYNNRFYCSDDYIVEISGEEIRFGVARGGHSGGYWFIPTITEIDNKTTFCGEIQYIDSYTGGKGKDRIGEIIFLIILLPILLISRIFLLFARIVKKVFIRTISEEERLEERLYSLMENHLNCIRK